MPTAETIRSLFLHPLPSYPLAEAAALLGMDWRDVRAWVESGELEAVDTEKGLVLPWGELVSFGMDFWSQEVVEEALGAEVAEAIPELLRLADLEVRIPRMQVVALERLAARERLAVGGAGAADGGDGADAGVARAGVGAFGVAVGGGAGVCGGVGLAGGVRAGVFGMR